MPEVQPFIISSSPTSGLVSDHGTPCTVYSPEDMRKDSIKQRGHIKNPPPFVIGSFDPDFHPELVQVSTRLGNLNISGAGDPFTSNDDDSVTIEKNRMHLSPTAPTFTPVNTMTPGFGGVSFLNASSVPDDSNTITTADPLPPIGQGTPSDPNTPTKPPRFNSFGIFTHNGATRRAFMMAEIPNHINPKEFLYMFNRYLFPSLDEVVRFELHIGCVYVGFTDVRDAERAMSMAKSLHSEWRFEYMTPRAFDNKVQPRSVAAVSLHEGQVLITAQTISPDSIANDNTIYHAVEAKIEECGPIKALHKLYPAVPHCIEFVVEFFDVLAAIECVDTLNGVSFDSYRMIATHYCPDLPRFTEPRVAQKLVHRGNHGDYHRGLPTQAGMASDLQVNMPMENIPLRPATIGDDRNQVVLYQPHFPVYFAPNPPEPKRFHKTRFHGRRSPAGNHNSVDVHRIQQGLDVRTTIMLRNIPNKMDQAMLKSIVDETSFGRYDFMYLRIDFANNCNVGYAFINFEFAIDIVDFVEAIAGQKWNAFNSDKIAEVSYATIQGRDCLIQKFRNSSVMLENPSFRPKLFHTGTGPLAGTEEAFPGPDNMMKMKRSIENAEHVGLFAPRAGQQFRDEQRRRRSQFDRGTRLAQIEDAYDCAYGSPHADHRRVGLQSPPQASNNYYLSSADGRF